MRCLPRVAVLVLGIATALTVAAPPISAGPPTPASDVAATIGNLADGKRALEYLPADFTQIMGYYPALGALADGSVRLVNPQGSCSVPGEGYPFDFEVACKAHDFGYDMLRYAARTQTQLPATAREDIDNQLNADLHAQCMADRMRTTRATCDATVTIFRAGVGFNTWRQVYEPPADESGLPRTAGVLLLTLIGLFTLIPGLRRRLLASIGGSGRRGYRLRSPGHAPGWGGSRAGSKAGAALPAR
ncbi:MAG TPA: phospholipase A2 [Candidatus Limnocylindrales bacterium]